MKRITDKQFEALRDLALFPRSPFAFDMRDTHALVSAGLAVRVKDSKGENWVAITEAGQAFVKENES